MLAEALDVEEVVNAQQKRSGFVLVIDPKSQEILTKLTRASTKGEISKALNDALKS